MAIFKIVETGDPVLRQKAKQVPRITPNIIKLLDNLADTMYDAHGVGLAAPQIGVSKRVIVVDTGNGLVELINPVIRKSSGEEVGMEGCLSIPGIQGEVSRATLVVISGLDRHGREVELEAKELPARALQHEIDHLNGVLFTDLALRLVRFDDEEQIPVATITTG